MEITSAKYLRNELTGDNEFSVEAIIDGRKWNVPKDTTNSDYIEIMRLVEAGELTIQDAE